MKMKLDWKWAILPGIALLAFQIALKEPLDEERVQFIREYIEERDQHAYSLAPDFEAQCLDGSTFRLSEQIGRKLVVLNFFSTRCAPCLKEMPEFEYFLERTEDMPVAFLAIAVGEDLEDLLAFTEKAEIKLPIALDGDDLIARKYNIRSFPTTVLIDASGHIHIYETGAISNVDVSLMPTVKSCINIMEVLDDVDVKDYLENAPAFLPRSATGEIEDASPTDITGQAGVPLTDATATISSATEEDL